MNRMRFNCVLACTILMSSGHALAQSAQIDPKADKVFHAMTTYLAGQKNFFVETENTLEVVSAEGQKIQFNMPASISVSRPNKFYAERKGQVIDQKFYYNGKSLTLYNPSAKVYSTVKAPATLDDALDFARNNLDIVAPSADLIDSRAATRMMEDVTSGMYLGVENIDGQRCHHLAYRAAEVDWQLWVREGDKPVPCRYVITSKLVDGGPEFTVQIRKWHSDLIHEPGKFDFVAPADAKAIQFLPPAKS